MNFKDLCFRVYLFQQFGIKAFNRAWLWVLERREKQGSEKVRHGCRIKKFRSASHSQVWWSLQPLVNVDGKFPPLEGILKSYRRRNSSTKRWWLGANSSSEEDDGGSKAKGLKSQELPISGHQSKHFRDNPRQRHDKTNLGFHEAKVSGINSSKASSIASSKENFEVLQMKKKEGVDEYLTRTLMTIR
jgi:hypothetical protein